MPHSAFNSPPSIHAHWRVTAADLIALRIHALALTAPPQFVAPLGGIHRTARRGRGMDYREARHYQMGDDVRMMDWRITARTGRPHVKVFNEERERPVIVLVDFNRGMFFATRGVFKSVQAARLAALIGWAVVRHGDRIGGLIASDPQQELVPRSGRSGQMRFIRALVTAGTPPDLVAPAVPFSSQHNLMTAVTRIRRIARPGSQVFLLSDWQQLNDNGAAQLALLARHCDVTAIQIVDQLELKPPPPGRYLLQIGAAQQLLDTRSHQQRQQYAAQLQQRQTQLQQLMRQSRIPLLQLLTTDDPVQLLAGVLGARYRATSAALTGHQPH